MVRPASSDKWKAQAEQAYPRRVWRARHARRGKERKKERISSLSISRVLLKQANKKKNEDPEIFIFPRSSFFSFALIFFAPSFRARLALHLPFPCLNNAKNKVCSSGYVGVRNRRGEIWRESGDHFQSCILYYGYNFLAWRIS